MTTRDEYMRSLVDIPSTYDEVIDYIARENPYAATAPDGAEAFAVNAVHACIRGVLYGDAGAWCATGGCTAVRISTRPDLPGYNTVDLFVRPFPRPKCV